MSPMAAASGLVRRASRTARAHLPWVPWAVGPHATTSTQCNPPSALFSDYDRWRRMTPEDAKPARHAAHASRAEKSAASRQLVERVCAPVSVHTFWLGPATPVSYRMKEQR